MRQTEFFVSYKILTDRFLLHGASPNMEVAKILEHILKQDPEEASGTRPSDYKILIAKQVVDPSNLTIRDLDLSDGGYLLFYRPQLSAIRLRLIPPKSFRDIQGEWVIENNEALVGRSDDFIPDVDLTLMLDDPRKISRKLAWLRADGERWTIELHPEAHSIIYVDETRLNQGMVVELNDGMGIRFGKNPNDPDLFLKVKLEPMN